MKRSAGSRIRILIGASSFADAAAALKILRALRPDTPFTYGGLFIEESATIALCHLPNQRIVSSGGTLVVAPSLPQVRTVLEADARAFRASLQAISGPAADRLTFERSMGDLVKSTLQASAGWDIIVFGHRNIHPVDGKIVLLETSRTNDRMIEAFADHLSDAVSAERVVFAVGPDAPDPPGHRRFETMTEALAAVDRMNVQAILVDLARGPIHSPDELRRLLELARCPVFAFGATLSGTRLEHGTQIPPAPGTRRDPNEP